MLFLVACAALSTNTLHTNADGDLEVDIAGGKSMVFTCPRAPRGSEIACTGGEVLTADGLCKAAEPCRGAGVQWTGDACEPIAPSPPPEVPPPPPGITADQLLAAFTDRIAEVAQMQDSIKADLMANFSDLRAALQQQVASRPTARVVAAATFGEVDQPCADAGELVVLTADDGTTDRILLCDGSEYVGIQVAPSGPWPSHTFRYTGATQRFTVPPGPKKMRVHLYGAGGGTGLAADGSVRAGGNGAYVRYEFAVQEGEVYAVVVGEGGRGGHVSPEDNAFGGGGLGNWYSPEWRGASGGGLTGVFKTTQNFPDFKRLASKPSKDIATQLAGPAGYGWLGYQATAMAIAGGGGGGGGDPQCYRDAGGRGCAEGGHGGDQTGYGGPGWAGNNGIQCLGDSQSLTSAPSKISDGGNVCGGSQTRGGYGRASARPPATPRRALTRRAQPPRGSSKATTAGGPRGGHCTGGRTPVRRRMTGGTTVAAEAAATLAAGTGRTTAAAPVAARTLRAG